MDPVHNPFTPNAGARPPLLAGRDAILEAFGVVLDRVAAGRTDKGFVITGLRGVGKTVLLGEFRTLARERGAVVVAHELPKGSDQFARKFPSLARKALLEVSPAARWDRRMRRAAAILRGFKAQFDPEGRWTITFDGADVEPVEGVADSGDFVMDLPDLMEALGEAAASDGRMIVFLLDEVQHMSQSELSALVMAKQRINQQELPIVIAGAGLPQLPRLTADAQTYAERAFRWPLIGQLPAADARLALLQPILRGGATIEEAAVDRVVTYTEGYPYFLQEYGKAVWDAAASSPITLLDVEETRSTVEAVLDQDFFSVRVAGIPDAELSYLLAMARLGPGPHSVTAVAHEVGAGSAAGVGATNARLTERGLVYRPQRGRVAFTVPQFDSYLRRSFPSRMTHG